MPIERVILQFHMQSHLQIICKFYDNRRQYLNIETIFFQYLFIQRTNFFPAVTQKKKISFPFPVTEPLLQTFHTIAKKLSFTDIITFQKYVPDILHNKCICMKKLCSSVLNESWKMKYYVLINPKNLKFLPNCNFRIQFVETHTYY